MKILVVAPNWIGDAVMAQPMLRLLRRRWPNARITALAPAHVAPVLDAMPEVTRTIPTWFGHGGVQLFERVGLARKLRREAFDRAYVLPNSAKSALIPWLAGIPVRVGYAGEWRVGLLNRRLPNPARNAARPPMVERYAALAVDDPQRIDRLDTRHADRPRLTVDPASVAITKAKFLGGAKRTIGFCPGAEFGPAKRWPPAHFAQLADRIAERYPDTRIVCLGGPGDAPIADAIVTASTADIANLCGHTQLKEAIALMKSLSAVVTNDTGLMHVAAALDVPVVALYGSTDPHHTPPHSPLARIEKIDIACSPCFQRECPLGHFRCMNDLSPDQVMNSLALVLAPAIAGSGGAHHTSA
ncbi:MAG TPA: lipopolysaccharide heptosyltransferase II [Burkholderiaceae bacterium]|nr:lipopolysaccharide heptosyltransferase II [Burkholderiaceae bacterium]